MKINILNQVKIKTMTREELTSLHVETGDVIELTFRVYAESLKTITSVFLVAQSPTGNGGFLVDLKTGVAFSTSLYNPLANSKLLISDVRYLKDVEIQASYYVEKEF